MSTRKVALCFVAVGLMNDSFLQYELVRAARCGDVIKNVRTSELEYTIEAARNFHCSSRNEATM